MQYLHTNNAASNLRDAITPGSSVITVTSGHGTLFPNPGVDQGFFVTVEDRRTGRLEIMLCTVRTGDSLTVTRGQQGTVPLNFAAGVSVANRVTAQILNEFVAATVNVVPIDRIPPIPDEKILGMSSTKLIGTVPTALLSGIPSSSITSLDAAKLTGTMPDTVLPATIPQANLPNIPSAKLTEVPAGNLTGTIAAARFADNTIAGTRLMSGQDASKITIGTLANARLPTTISISGSLTSGSLTTTGNVSIGGAITAVDSVAAAGVISGILQHKQDGGYVNVGAYNAATQGVGTGRFYYDANQQRFIYRGHSATRAGIEGADFFGNGATLSNIMGKDTAAYEVGAVAWLLGSAAVAANTVYDGSVLRLPNLRVDSSDNSLHMSFSSSGPAGNWKALQSAGANAGERAFAQFVRVS